ncbi:hypothetical protein E2C01_097002 [Portunus trituberculatus]|uniref:Uncharacterized protein n=1 Tax=Portunus trituberculatus TaxID=210409 RepID=A0A5B7K381_PORTR|nr:hypothetical protein [Portunus trituberculatus]
MQCGSESGLWFVVLSVLRDVRTPDKARIASVLSVLCHGAAASRHMSASEWKSKVACFSASFQ